MKTLKIAQYIALVATVLSILGFCLDTSASMTLMGLGFFLGLASYIFGGLGTAIKMAGKIAKWGWIVVPFPYDLITGFASFAFAIVAFIFLPIIPIRKAYKETMC